MPPSTSTTDPRQCPCKVCVHERNLRLARRVCVFFVLAGSIATSILFVTLLVSIGAGDNAQPWAGLTMLSAAVSFASNWLGKLLTDGLNVTTEFRGLAAQYLGKKKK